MPESRSSAARARLLGGLLGGLLLALLALAAASILAFPAWLHPPLTEQELAGIRDPKDQVAAQDARRQRQNEARATLLQGVGALLVFTSAVVGAYFTWRQVRHNRDQLDATREQLVTAREQVEVVRRQAEDSDRHARDQLEIARQGQVTERFTRAIDQLGSDQLDVRLGGIYALERIARDSDADRPTIGEILTAYVRQHSPWPPTQRGQYKPDWPLNRQPALRDRAPDVQAALTVLGRGRFASLAAGGGARLDLQAADLRNADLCDADLVDVNLLNANLAGATLYDASLAGAMLAGANLTRANLFCANLAGAILFGTNLKYAGATTLTRWPNGFDWRAAGVSLATVADPRRGVMASPPDAAADQPSAEPPPAPSGLP